jgi:DNA-binding transcriptional MerR regulator
MTTTPEPLEILIGDAARILAISPNHVRYLERTGQLRARRIGHIRVFVRAEVEALAADRYRRATGQVTWRGESPLQV